ncbi:MAG: rRNA maturation RNase YbeY [Anaerolineaceae bacterium]
MIDVFIHPDNSSLVSQEWVEKLADLTIKQLYGDEKVELSIALEQDDVVKDLNFKYRSVDATTDVLSFEDNYPNPETGLIHVGDIIISVPQAQKQAITAGHSLNQELALLIVHGVLHLDGYDHTEVEDEKVMWEKQGSILMKFQNFIENE